jgi:hypothetical protein
MTRRNWAGLNWAGCIVGVIWGLLVHSDVVAGVRGDSSRCAADLARQIPVRQAAGPTGSVFVQRVMELSGKARDRAVSAELLAGNLPAFLRHLTPVTFSGVLPDGRDVDVTICVTPDYLAVGTDSDFVRVPMGLPAAAGIADRFGFLLPTTRMVDAIHAQARVRLSPSPMQPTSQMRSTDYLWRHNQTIDRQRAESGRGLGEMTAGHKKDLVLSNRLKSAAGRVAIYGWHRRNGSPIQPLSTVHGEGYADYSHGVRLVSPIAFVDGVARSLTAILQDTRLAATVSSEGSIAEPGLLQASLHRGWAMQGSARPAFAALRR